MEPDILLRYVVFVEEMEQFIRMFVSNAEEPVKTLLLRAQVMAPVGGKLVQTVAAPGRWDNMFPVDVRNVMEPAFFQEKI